VSEIVLPRLIGLPLIDDLVTRPRPSAAAAVFTRTLSTGRRLPPEVMNRPVKRTNAKMMFAAGPAKITSTRFQVRARQYASGPSASPMSVTPLSTPASAGSES
jgi:hypothetical protein